MTTSSTPVFIGGSPRSGTTLLLRMLGRHPGVEAYYESKIVCSLIEWLEGTVFNPFDRDNPYDFRLHEYFDRDQIYRSFGSALGRLFGERPAAAGKVLWVEKTPRNALHVDSLLRMLPESKFVHMVRDGRDVAVSMPKLEDAPRTVPECARLWAGYVSAGRSACRRHPQCAIEVRYEDLVRSPQEVMPSVCKHLCIEVMPEMLDIDTLKVSLFEENWGPGATPATPIGRWKRYPDFPKEAFKEAAGSLLIELGYEHDPQW